MLPNTDPLADSAPPRHAIESDDEEDEFNPLPHPTSETSPTHADVRIMPDNLPKKRPLVVFAGNVAEYTARGIAHSLGELTAAVYVNDIETGQVFTPAFTKALVLVSEATARLPLWAMYPYAIAILAETEPTARTILDAYALPAYISAHDEPPLAPPIRYLCNGAPPPTTAHAELFAPPNMIQDTAAALLACRDVPGVLALLPAPHIPPPAPKSIVHTWDEGGSYGDEAAWSASTMSSALALLFGDAAPTWDAAAATKHHLMRGHARRTDADDGMYI
ncbi:hypothetical protein FISHEDRAFT_71816 [Fistulina hepatica ATCC 64428]|uniref:Proteasome assembly chaperone 1 n=1 Tax=Fistulina hepatica ATCC 64428 TaxID=1128425 RepID=A0A0D7AH77_9AGAR|nr:hypothetical protein FISHEDRAFT_71816 [Fistulina hepatica ATCC 64428]